MEGLLQTLAAGLTNGAVYGIAALGIVLVFRVSRVINLAQGEAITAGALGTWWLDARAGWPRPAAAIIAIAATASFFGVASRWTVLRAGSAARADVLTASLVTLALALFGQGLLFAAFGRELHGSPSLLGAGPLHLAGASIPAHTVLVLGVTLAVAGLLGATLRWTMPGLAMAACAENRTGAAAVGVDVGKVIVVTFGLAAALGALAGVLLAPITVFSYLTGFGLGLRGLAAAALVGFRSATAGLAAGLAVGVLEAGISAYVSSGYQEPFVAALLIAALVTWPGLTPASEHR
ncbi:MAG TPA: branched-chain amino acid ABC transporter permease [Acidimicrobiia bacterium]|nr:branched-chain amino acid ABC transporter permease [Acidimicrobiia bacterium]